MQNITEASLEQLVAHFNNRTLPKASWNHQAHIIVAFWYNYHYAFEEALNLIRQNIKAYNLAVGTPNTDDSGYHETLTVFWMRLTQTYLKNNPHMTLTESCHAFLQSEYADKHYPFDFFTQEVLFSKKARKTWIDGNRKSVVEYFQ